MMFVGVSQSKKTPDFIRTIKMIDQSVAIKLGVRKNVRETAAVGRADLRFFLYQVIAQEPEISGSSGRRNGKVRGFHTS
jgi:hypothetical protein